MRSHLEQAEEALRKQPRNWLVTGAAGFIGSHLVQRLLDLGQTVIGLDSFSTGRRENLDDVRKRAGTSAWRRFKLIEGDIRNPKTCHLACQGTALILHQAALGSVPRSVADPLATHQSNVDGFLNMLIGARDAKVERFIYASSSSVYGDHPGSPKLEDELGRPLSPYAGTKRINEIYADIFARTYDLGSIGLRYFNVFGPRQDPNGPYAAVIPRWLDALFSGRECIIYGDGETSRDFSYIDNTVQANILAATAADSAVLNQVYNVACGSKTTLNELFSLMQERVAKIRPEASRARPRHVEPRVGDIRQSLAGIGKIQRLLGFVPTRSVATGLDETVNWYASTFSERKDG